MTRQPQHRIHSRSRRALALVAVLTLAVPGPSFAAPNSGPVKSAQQANPPAPPRTVLQKIRELLGLNPPIATGGSRSGGSQSVCMITPRFQSVPGQTDLATAVAVVPLGSPTLLAAEPLNEVRIERNGTILWRRLASSTQAIEGPINWPLDPLMPNESLLLKLRPRGGSGGEFAVLQITAASAPAMARQTALVSQLANDPARWWQSIEQQADQGNQATAVALLFDSAAPAVEPVLTLRKELLRAGCR
jgi:hypothetical protein